MPNIQKAYKFRLKTNSDIENKLSRFCGSSRFLWNKFLAMNLERLENQQSLLILWSHSKREQILTGSIQMPGLWVWREC